MDTQYLFSTILIPEGPNILYRLSDIPSRYDETWSLQDVLSRHDFSSSNRDKMLSHPDKFISGHDDIYLVSTR